jgi:uncharacterized membrane protein YedE/YeeE
MWTLFYLLAGAAFGFTLSRSGASDYDYIQGMFLFRNEQLYGIIGTAVAVTMVGLFVLKARGRTLRGEKLELEAKPRHLGNILGGVLFGVGWSITGMCPGPVLVNLGEGKLYAAAAFLGVLCGVFVFGRLYPWLARSFGLPPLTRGTGDG